MLIPRWSYTCFLLALVACKTPPPPERHSLNVDVVRVIKGDSSSVFEATGEVRAKVESTLSFRLSGKVTERKFDVGDHVEAGTLLARLDPRQEVADVEVAKAGVTSAEASLKQAELELGREKNLFAQQATSKKAYDAKEEAMLFAKGSLASAKATLASTRDRLSYTELRTARAGVVVARNIEVGQVVQATAPAYTFAEDGPRDAVFRIHETVAARLDVNTKLALRLTEKPAITAVGVVREISPIVDAATASVLVCVTIINPPAEMALRTPVVGQMKLTASKTVTLPAVSIFSDHQGKPAVWVIDEAKKEVALRPIDVGAYESRSVVIIEGLKDGELVVSRGANRLRPGQTVTYAEGGSRT